MCERMCDGNSADYCGDYSGLYHSVYTLEGSLYFMNYRILKNQFKLIFFQFNLFK